MYKKLLLKRVLSLAFLFLLTLSIPGKLYSAEIEVGRDSTRIKFSSSIKHESDPKDEIKLEQSASGTIDFVSAAPASRNGAIIAEVSDRTYNSDGSATAQVEVKNVTSIWYKLCVETTGDVELNLASIFEGDNGKCLFLPPDGKSSFAYPALSPTITFNEPNSAVYFTADRSVASGIGALLLQQLEILHRASPAYIPALPHDKAGAMVEVLETTTQGFDPFIDAAKAIYDGDVRGIISGVSELGRDPVSIAQLQLAFKKIGYTISVDKIKSATSLLNIITLSWYIADFVGESLGSSAGDGATVKAFDFDGASGSTKLDAQMTISGEGQSAPTEVRFDAAGSYSSEGIQSYTWDFGDNSSDGSGENIQHIFTQPGNYNVRLTITDSEGNTDQTSQIVQVYAPSFSLKRETLYKFNFIAQADNNITGYTWDFGDGNTTTGRTTNHTFDRLGKYKTTLTLALAGGGTTKVTRTIYAGPQPVYVSGTIESDRIWPASHGPYVIKGFVGVSEGATLTIEAGAVMKFSEYADLSARGGTLNAEGTQADSVIFTSIKNDKYGGDTNGDGTKSSPAAGDWGHIEFEEGADGSIDHAIISYGGETGSLKEDYDNMVRLQNSSPQIINSRIIHSIHAGLSIWEAYNDFQRSTTPEIRNNVFTGNHNKGVKVRYAGGMIRGNTFRDNGTAIQVEVRQDQLSPAPVISGNTGSKNNINGIRWGGILPAGEATWPVNEGLPFVIDYANVAHEATLTIEAGTVVKFKEFNSSLYVDGILEAKGTEADSVVFTSIRNDKYGGDTNGDKDETVPSIGDWGTIRFEAGDGTLDHAILSYGGNRIGDNTDYMIWLQGASPTITNSRITGSIGAGIRARAEEGQEVSPKINYNQFTDNKTYAISLDNTGGEIRQNTFTGNGAAANVEVSEDQLSPAPWMVGNTGSGNNINGIRWGGILPAGEATWPVNEGLPFLSSNVRISTNASLTVEPGTVVKFEKYYMGLHVEGKLTAEGTRADSVVFTSIKNDKYYGDTNGDGNESIPSEADWESISFESGSSGGISFAIISYGGDGSPDKPMIDIQETSIPVTDSKIIYSADNGIEIRLQDTKQGFTTINNNLFLNNKANAIDLDNIVGTISRNEFIGNGAAIQIRQEKDQLERSSEIRSNTFDNNKDGVKVYGSLAADIGTSSKAGKNIFRGNTNYAIRSITNDTVKAIGNFWNTTDASVIDNRIEDDDERNSAPVIFEPFLDGPPEDTGGDVTTITSVEPNRVTGSSSDQPITVKGSGFKEGAFVILDDLDDDQGPFENPSKTTFVSSTELTRQATFTENAAIWSAQVENSDGSRSDTVHFEVVSPDAPPASGSFAYPVGPSGSVTEANDGDGWYNAQDFGEANADFDNKLHLGEDWNAESGGNTDCGDPVYAASAGTIVYAQNAGESLGNVIVVRHTLPNGKKVETLYDHLKSISRKSGTVKKREQVGTIGNADGYYPSCHLHFAVRLPNSPSWGSHGPGYANSTEGWTDPSDFIDGHSSQNTTSSPPIGLTVSTSNGNIELSWDANTEEDLAGYNLYRSTSSFSEISEATKLNGSELISGESYTDDGVEDGTTYFYRLTAVDTDGNESGLSEEVQETLDGGNAPPASPDVIEALIWTQEALTGGYIPDNYKFNELRNEYKNGIKHLAYLSAGKFVFGFGVYIDADDYAGITGEGRSLDGGEDGWVTVWIDGSIGIEAALPAFGGMTKIKYDENSPDPLRNFQLSKPGVEASAINIEFLNYEEGQGFTGYNSEFEPTAAFEASISLLGVGTNITRFEIKRSALDEIVNNLAIVKSGRVGSLKVKNLRNKFLAFVTGNYLGVIGESLYAIRKAFTGDSRREFTFSDSDEKNRPDAAAYFESTGGGIDTNKDDIPDNFYPLESSSGTLGWEFLLNVRSFGNTDTKYVVEADTPTGWNVRAYCKNFILPCTNKNQFVTDKIPLGELSTTEWRVSANPNSTSNKANVTFSIYEKGNPDKIFDKVTTTFRKYDGKIIVYNGRSPIELHIETPSGKTITPDKYDANQTMYNQFDVDGSGSEDAQVLIASPEKGVHKIEVVPNEDANPEDTYTLEAIENGTVKTLAENEMIRDIPDSSYSYAAGIEPPASPSNFVLKTSGAQSTLEWQKNNNEFLKGYLLYSGKDPNKLAISDTLANSATSYPIHQNGTSYYSISAFDINGNESPLSPWVSYVKDQLNISNRWQMISNPAIEEKKIGDANAFGFDGTYKEDSVLTAGKGYWVKSEQNQTVPLQDQGLDSTKIQLAKGWNLIGSLVDTLNKSAISDPESVIGSAPVYSYNVENSKYEKTTKFLPKQGYWLYADRPGPITLHFNKGSSTQTKANNLRAENVEHDRLIFSNETAERNIVYFYSALGEEARQRYLLPPVAPAAVMDVRTPNGYKAIDSGSGEINLTAQRYPVQIQMEGQSEGGFVYQIIATDEEKKKTQILTAASPVILDQEYETIRVTRLSEDEVITENDLDPNFPNPFSSTTQIVYRLAETSQVKLIVYDVIGRKVETLVDEEQTTGEYPVTFDGSGLASGVYIIQLKLDEDVKDQKITLIK